jgi:signal transduction histidine kinase
MLRYSYRQYYSLAIDIVLLIGCFVNAPLVLERAQAPFSVRQEQQSLFISGIGDTTAARGLRTGDRIISWNSQEVTVPEMVEFLADLSSIGDEATVILERGGDILTSEIFLVPYYRSPRFLIVSLCVGFITWLVGIFILLQRNSNPAADILHWALITLGSAIMITWGRIDPASVFSGISRVIFFSCYTLSPALFVLFSAAYPRQTTGTMRSIVILTLLFSLPLIAAQSFFHFMAIYGYPVRYFPLFQTSFDLFNIFLLICFVLMVSNLFGSYYRAVRTADKRRLEWILWGFCASPVPFVLFIKLPQMAGIAGGMIDEELTTFFFLLIPFSCAVSLVQYNLVDIRLVISRSIIYTALTLFVGIIYSLTILLAATSVDTQQRFEEYLLVGAVILFLTLVLDPVRKKLHRVFDELLFPARVFFRRTTSEVRELLYRSLTADEVYRTLQHRVTEILSFKTFALYQYGSGYLTMTGPKNSTLPETVPFAVESLAHFEGKKIAALPSALNFHSDEKIVYGSSVPMTLGCTVCVVLMTESGRLAGIAAGTPSAVSGQFTEEETDLLTAVCTEAAEALDRLFLQEEMIIQHAETKRLEELSRMKSYFVSSVSHELRTPLTSIRMFAEMLLVKNVLPRKVQREYLQIIEGESERLTRLVENVLNFSAIERRGKEYRFSEIDLSEIVQRSANAMRYQFLKQNAHLGISIAKKIPRLHADPDALEEVCINLLSNGLKYSTNHPAVRIRAGISGRNAVIEVSDRGIGIPEQEIGNIFKDFYRVNDPLVRQAGGTGLGLSLVKHIVEAHGGTIKVRSTAGKGSTFTVYIPLKQRKSV